MLQSIYIFEIKYKLIVISHVSYRTLVYMFNSLCINLVLLKQQQK